MAKTERREEDFIQAVPMPRIQERLLACLDQEGERGVADAVDLAISQGAYHGASDLHLEPWDQFLSLRYRIDGILHQVALIPRDYQSRVTARVKVLADLVVYRKDAPQDGRIDVEKTSCGRPMRVSSVPTIKGEKIVIRLLGDTSDLYRLDSLGFPKPITKRMREIIAQSQGVLLLTGPSSSGKTTTIYALLSEMMSLQKHTVNIVTIEDPVEYRLDKVAQIQVNPHAEFTFANALRAILRQDPEVIMVGEIRDVETAKMAVQAGLTGHFVISTIHSGTAAGVFTRLLDMGIEPFLVASSLSGVLAQRLVRLNCPECAKPYKPDPITLALFGLDQGGKQRYLRGEGCDACHGIGYRGRASIGELLIASQEIAELALTRPTTRMLHTLAVEQGLKTIADDGLDKVSKGITTLEELVRVLPTQIG